MPKPEEFPALGNAKQTKAIWGKSFASLATDWSKKDEDERIEKEIQDEIERRRREREELNNRHVIIRRRVHDDIPEDEFDDDDSVPTKDDWTTIERKVRPVLTAEERAMRADAREREEKLRKQEEESVWDDEQWDFRDRRIQS
jgi:hypothetical protein